MNHLELHIYIYVAKIIHFQNKNKHFHTTRVSTVLPSWNTNICCLVCMSSNFVSHQATWHNKRTSVKGYSVPRHFSWIENHKLICFLKEITSLLSLTVIEFIIIRCLLWFFQFSIINWNFPALAFNEFVLNIYKIYFISNIICL